MVLESTMVCIDNSDFMRNGDFVPTRLQAQQDAVNLVCHSKTRSNPENNLGLLTLANTEVLATLTADSGRILSKLHQVQPKGNIGFVSGVRIAHLALKHRQGKNHKMRIVIFVGSPIEDDEKELVKQAKRLKKEKVQVDVVNFGEEAVNTDKLTAFINTINGKDGTGSHLVTVPPGPLLSDALVSSPVIVGEDGSGAVPAGTGYEFGVDPNEDPELALALRVSMEEQRARQEEEQKRVQTESAADQPALTAVDESNEEALLKQAMEMSLKPEGTTTSATTDTAQSTPDISMLSEEEQIALAMQMSMDPSDTEDAGAETPMDTEEGATSGADQTGEDEDYSEVINDPAFLQSVLEGLPGVDPSSDAIRTAMSQLTKPPGSDKDSKDKPKDDK